jgi:hypothetical protein
LEYAVPDEPPMLVPTAPAPPPTGTARRSLLRQPTLYPALYICFVLLSALDLLFTWRILAANGREENALANWIINRHGLPGLVTYKFGLVVGVVFICEIVGRRRAQTGAKLARWAVVMTAFPVVVGAVHLLRIAMGLHGF